MHPLKHFCFYSFLFFSFFAGENGIAQIAIGQWRDHLSYRNGISITQSNTGQIYCATDGGAFRLNTYDNSLELLSKTNGFSDVGVNVLKNYSSGNMILLAYKNANIDIIDGAVIHNISDIKRAIITANKTIHNIYFRSQYAYLACGFGIVVLDMTKKEIKETYFIGTNGGYINVRDINADNNYIYAATDSGVYRALWSSPNLADFNAWEKMNGLPSGIYNSLAVLNGILYTNLSVNLKTGESKKDTIYAFNGTNWYKPFADSVYQNDVLKKMEVFNIELVISFYDNVKFFDANGNYTNKVINAFVAGYSSFESRQAIIDQYAPLATWIADHENGITKNWDMWGGTNSYYPNGPNTSEALALTIEGEELWAVRGDKSSLWIGTYKEAEAYRFSGETWSSFTKKEIPALDTMRDIVSVAIDPANPQHVYLGTLGQGVVELQNGALVNIFNETNSSLGVNPNYYWVGVFGMTFDQNGNLWLTNAYADSALSVRKADGSWQAFSLLSVLPAYPTLGQIIANQYNQKWIVLPRGGGILVFDENGTWATSDDKMKKLTSGAGNGNLPTNDLFCLAEDKDGEIWVGTNKGIAVFYCPEEIFTSGCEAQQIFIQQDGHTQILLETEQINFIAIDGANRKWIATQNSGAYLMSEDGTEEVKHFTAENSPLLSNEVRSIAINQKTGEVFFATALGIISFRNDATEGLEDFTDVYVFPNPVKPGYEGPIAINGLVENADVKITDITGNLVYQTKALGGQAVWYGANFSGERARSGVYLVFCASEDGSKTYIAKILMVQ